MKFTFAPEARPLPGYTIKRAIDRGGFGEVYYGVSDSGKEVALKLLQQHQDVELRGTSQCLNLKHQNLVTLFDIRTDAEGDRWVIMEYVTGPSLEQVLLEHPRGLPPAEVEQWLEGIAVGVGFLHDRGIVHRDLKPANIFRENGVVKVGDVGLSKSITPSRRSAQTESVGTVYYMAPEVARGKYGSELDVYSTGVILFEMLTGELPFNGESTGEILMKHLTEPPDVSRLPARFQGVVARALAKDPQKRTPSLQQLFDDYRRAQHGAAAASPREAPAPRPVFAPRPVPVARQTAERERGSVFYRNRWELLGLAVIGLLFLRAGPRLGPLQIAVGGASVAFLVLVAGSAYATYRLVTWLAWSSGILSPDSTAPSTPVGQGMDATLPHSPRTVPEVVAATRTGPATAQTSRAVEVLPRASGRQQWAELAGGMARAVPWSLLATAGFGLTTTLFGDSARHIGFDPARIGLFAFTTVLAAWMVMLVSKVWEGRQGDPLGRRLVLASLGGVLGVAAYWLDGILMVDLPFDNRTRSLFETVGHQPLITEAVQPTLMGYLLFFAALFGLRCWWRQGDVHRGSRFRISSMLFTGLVGFFVPAIFVFPQTWGASLAAAISGVVQLATAWKPVDSRHRRKEACRHV